MFSIFQYIMMAFAYSISKPYRAPIYSNPHLMINFGILIVSAIYLNVMPAEFFRVCFLFCSCFYDPMPFQSFLQLDEIFFQHHSLKYYLWGLVVLNSIATYVFEKYVMANRLVITFLKRFVPATVVLLHLTFTACR